MKLLIVGTGHVGLVTGACLAHGGHHVVCLDINQQIIDALNRGHTPFFEPRLEELLHAGIAGKNLFFTSDYAEALAEAEVCFLTIGSPSLPSGEANLEGLLSAAEALAQHMHRDILVVVKSTVPAGTNALLSREMERVLQHRQVSWQATLVSNPEYLSEGDAVKEFLEPDRIVLGSDDPEIIRILKTIYMPFVPDLDRFIVMDILSAELAKYAANVMLALRISFMNELSSLCEAIGADIDKIRQSIGADVRIGHSFLYAGPGYGGSCLPKDVKALGKQFAAHNLPAYITLAIDKVNSQQQQWAFNKVVNHLKSAKQLSHATIGILGLSYKPETDDVRESPSLVLIDQLLAAGATLRLYDPMAMPNGKLAIGQHASIVWCQDLYGSAKGADALIIMTKWKEFSQLDFQKLHSLMQGKVLIDSHNQFDAEAVARQGFDYISVGCPARSPKQS